MIRSRTLRESLRFPSEVDAVPGAWLPAGNAVRFKAKCVWNRGMGFWQFSAVICDRVWPLPMPKVGMRPAPDDEGYTVGLHALASEHVVSRNLCPHCGLGKGCHGPHH